MITEEQKEAFLKDLFELYEKHDLAISHEDYHGGFQVTKRTPDLIKWMSDCSINDEEFSRR